MDTHSTGRRLIDGVAEYIGGMDRVDRIVVVEAPTGYGKTVGAPTIASANYLKGFSYNFIHVLPLRAIVEDLYLCKYMLSLGGGLDELGGVCRSTPPEAFSRALKAMGVHGDDVAYQMGFDYMLRGFGRKSPTYDARIVISTLDSFAYNFLRIPVTEIFRTIKHYAIPRLRIFTSTIFLDEVHMLKRFDDESSERVLALLKLLVEFSLKTQTPLVISTATLWSRFREALKDWSGGRVVFFTLSNTEGKRDSVVYVRDRDFEDLAKSIDWSTGVVDESEIASKAVEHAMSGERVLVVRDSIESAIDTFSKLDIDGKILIHGRLCLEDRERALEGIQRARVVVATPVIEAGVDWDFDVGFRDAVNIPSVVQVFGRVCRGRRDCSATVYLIRTSESSRDLLELVRSYKVNWRLPYSYTDGGAEVKGYAEALEKTQMSLDVDVYSEDVFRALTAPVTLPSTYISRIVRDYNYSVFREPLTQLYVYGYSALESARSFSDVIAGTFTYSLDFVKRRLSSIEGFACVLEVDGGISVERVELDVGRGGISGGVYAQKVLECVERAAEVGGRIVFSGFVIREGVYVRGLGAL